MYFGKMFSSSSPDFYLLPHLTSDISGKGDRVEAGDISTLTCTITGSSSLLNVTWSRVGDVTLPGDVTTSPGTWSAGTQVATLVQKKAQSNSTFRCGVEDGAGKKHFVNIDLQVIPGEYYVTVDLFACYRSVNLMTY